MLSVGTYAYGGSFYTCSWSQQAYVNVRPDAMSTQLYCCFDFVRLVQSTSQSVSPVSCGDQSSLCSSFQQLCLHPCRLLVQTSTSYPPQLSTRRMDSSNVCCRKSDFASPAM